PPVILVFFTTRPLAGRLLPSSGRVTVTVRPTDLILAGPTRMGAAPLPRASRETVPGVPLAGSRRTIVPAAPFTRYTSPPAEASAIGPRPVATRTGGFVGVAGSITATLFAEKSAAKSFPFGPATSDTGVAASGIVVASLPV